MSVRRGGGLAAAATATPRDDPRGNEDAFAVLGGPAVPVRGVAVADGVGSYSHARLAADAAVRGVAAASGALRRPAPAALRALFQAAHAAVREAARDESGDGGEAPAAESFGTTLLVALDTPADLWAAYLGNGAIWHVRGNFDGFPAATALPWCAVNVLAPHSVLHHGREVLYRIVDASAEPAPPSVVRLQPDPEFGDLLVVCTDGIYSADQLTQGTDVNGSLWVSAEAAMVELFRTLRELFAGWDGRGQPELYRALAGCLGRLRDRGMLEDDATVGVIVTAAALGYHRRKRARATPAAVSAAPDAIAVDEASDVVPPVRAAADTASPGDGSEGVTDAEGSSGTEVPDGAVPGDLSGTAAGGVGGVGGVGGPAGGGAAPRERAGEIRGGGEGEGNDDAAGGSAGPLEEAECPGSPTSPA